MNIPGNIYIKRPKTFCSLVLIRSKWNTYERRDKPRLGLDNLWNVMLQMSSNQVQ